MGRKRLILILSLLVTGIVIVGLNLFSGMPDSNIIWNIRMPRLLLTLYTGMVLGAVGSVYQLMLVNPLAEPYILGVSSGSALGSIMVAILGFPLLAPLGGFAGAAVTLLVVWRLAQRRGSFDRSRLLLAGVIVGMFCAAGISLLMYLFQKDTMLILGTLMGNLGHVFTRGEWNAFLILAGFSLLLLIRLGFHSSALDIMSGGDAYAGSVGIDVSRVRREIFILSSILIGISVSYAGIIGFVGLIIPHMVRFFVHPRQQNVLLFSMCAGALFLSACDLAARNMVAVELPVGVVTAAVGCPVFIWLMLRK